MRYLLRGKYLGEALMLSNFYTNWSTAYIGDPLMHPDLMGTTIDKTAPVASGKQVSIGLSRNEDTLTASFSAQIDYSYKTPDVAVLRVRCKDKSGQTTTGSSLLFSRRPIAVIKEIAPGEEYHCSVTLADPYENQSRLPDLTFKAADITTGENFTQGVVDFFKGIKLVPR